MCLVNAAIILSQKSAHINYGKSYVPVKKGFNNLK